MFQSLNKTNFTDYMDRIYFNGLHLSRSALFFYAWFGDSLLFDFL